MRRRLLAVVTALVAVGGSPFLMAGRASAYGLVETQATMYRCHATVTVQQGFIYGADFTRVASGSGVCQRVGDTTQLLDRIDLDGTWTRDQGTGLACPPFRYSFDHVRLWSSYFVNRTQEWREVTDTVTDLNTNSRTARQVFGVYDSPNSSVPESFGISQTADQDTCASWTDISAPDFTTTADWTFPIGYPFNGPPPDGLLSVCVRGYQPIWLPQYCTEI